MQEMPNRNIGAFEVDSDDCLKEYHYVFQKDLLKDKVAFITGGGSGISFRIAEIFMRHSCKVVIASRSLERVQSAATKLEQGTGSHCLALQVDVRNPASLHKVIDEILSRFGKLDILVNNAAGNFLCPAEHLSYNAFKTVLEIDTVGTFNASKTVFEKYFKRNGGNIINISATLDRKGTPLQLHAGSAKAAIDAMTRHLAVEWGLKDIRVNCIAPGPIGGTEGMRRLGGQRKGNPDSRKQIPLQRIGYKTEIAESALFLVSDASSYVTGTVLTVDGGSWMTQAIPISIVKEVKSRL